MAQPRTDNLYGILPGPNYRPSAGPLALSGTEAIQAPQEPQKGLLDMAYGLAADYLPELFVNATTTRLNHTPAGREISRAAHGAPASLVVAIVGGLVAYVTRAKGTVGTAAAVIAKGSAHATVSEMSRPVWASPPAQNTSGFQPSDPPPTEP